MIGVFGGVRFTPGLGGVRSAPGPKFGVHHRFTIYYCEHPTSVHALKLPTYCLTQKTKDDTTNQTTDLTMTDKDLYQLLQRATYHEFEAHQCIQTRSRLFYSCVWASHSVMNVVPETGRHVVTAIDFCTQAIKSNMYVTEAGASVSLNADGPTYIVETIKGNLNVRADRHCLLLQRRCASSRKSVKTNSHVTRNTFNHKDSQDKKKLRQRRVNDRGDWHNHP